MEQVTIRFGERVQRFPYSGPARVSDLLAQAGMAFPMPCAGNHTCGKCKVTAYGALSPLTEEERSMLTTEERLSNLRLACCAEVRGACAIRAELPEHLRVEHAAHDNGACGEWGGPSPFGDCRWTLAADIGTTTVAAYLIDARGTEPVTACELNAQAPYGADVISRIGHAAKTGVGPLQQALLTQLDRLFAGLLASEGLPARAVGGVALAGNTTMLHLLAGLDPAGIAAAPYTPQSLFGVMYTARGRFPSLPPAAPVYLAPCMSAYVGGDAACALTACALRPGELLLDVGTNGEMAFFTGDELLCCSTAAGPAFEGAGLRQGMLASDGAINRVSARDGRLVWEVLGGGRAHGICGTGIIGALAAMLELGALDETGLIAAEFGDAFPIGDSGVSVTQGDVRRIQLAKAAVSAGVDALLDAAGAGPAFVRTVYIAGGFGNCINPEDAARIGLIPPELAGRVRPAGNAAGRGACLCAASQRALDETERLARSARVLDLTGNPYFNERYIEQMLFPAPIP